MPESDNFEVSAPIGSVIAFAGPPNNIPKNWLVCDGRKVSQADFPKLHNRIGSSWGGDGSPYFYLPDLRGQFLRGVDRSHDGSQDPNAKDPNRNERSSFLPPGSLQNPGNSGNNVGSFQRSATAIPSTAFLTNDSGAHSHSDPTWNGQAGPFELATIERGPGGYDYGPQAASTSLGGIHHHQVVGGGDSETRPQNAYVYFIIRAK